MSTETEIIRLAIPDAEIIKSGVDAATYVRGVAKRRAIEKSSELMMVEYRYDQPATLHRATVYLKAK